MTVLLERISCWLCLSALILPLSLQGKDTAALHLTTSTFLPSPFTAYSNSTEVVFIEVYKNLSTAWDSLQIHKLLSVINLIMCFLPYTSIVGVLTTSSTDELFRAVVLCGLPCLPCKEGALVLYVT